MCQKMSLDTGIIIASPYCIPHAMKHGRGYRIQIRQDMDTPIWEKLKTLGYRYNQDIL